MLTIENREASYGTLYIAL